MDFDADNHNLIGIFTTDEQFVVQVWDAALEQMTGLSAAAVRGKSAAEIIPNLEERGLLARFRRVLAEGTVEILSPAFHRFLIECPPRFPSKHLTEMRQRVTIAPLKENETIRGLIVTIEDVTARIEHEIELTERLKNADETVRLEAAKAISHEPESFGTETAAPIIDALGDKNWRVRRELVESLSRRAAPEAIAALLRAMQERHLDFGVLNSALQILQATSVKTTETLIEFLHGSDADLRMQAALTLGEQNDLRAIPALLEALADEDVNVRYHAVEALGKLKASEAAEALLEIAERRDFFLAFAALDALRQTADSPAATRILPLLTDDYLREAVIETLGVIGSEEVVAPLANLFNEDKSSAAAVAGALAALFERFEKSPEIVGRARREVGEQGKANLLEALENIDENDSTALIRVAGWFDDEKIREKLAALIENENVRETAAQTLAGQGAAAFDLLAGMLDADDAQVRRLAIRSLGETGDFRGFELLADLLKNGDSGERQAAAAALKTLAHPETVGRLCDLLTETDAQVREAAVRVVGFFGAKGCEDAMLDASEDTDERVRRAALEQLANLTDGRAVPALIRALKQGSSRERETAAKALAQVKTEESAAALREALGDTDSWTRYFAVRALGALRDTASLEILTEMAETDAAEQVRAAAAEVANELRA
jgi:PAS domain S-box-containing protein